MRFLLLAAQLLLSFVVTRATTATITSRDGTKLYAEAIGNKSGPHIIFAHGLACTLTAFDPLFEDKLLVATHYLVRFDTRGHGLSDKPLTPDFYTSDRYADDLKALISKFKLVRPFFAGWSLGGAIAADIATNFPHPLPFSGLIWLGGLPYLGDILPKVATPLVLNFLPGLQTDNGTLSLSTRVDFVDTLSAKNGDVPYDTRLAWVGSAGYLPPAVATLVLSRTQDPARLLAEGAAGWPLLILHGTADKQIDGTAVINNLAPKFKNVEKHLIKGAGHILFYDDEPSVAKYLIGFTTRIALTKPYPLKHR